ncbi:hypothetical protein EW146_g9033 [Bondarzewia mesenterica]|uniref:Transmembrane protein n=1 Tax=Bondarzewia mesenterica TaxID=1095465 RepID=A0A4S4L9T7_9AGAM|nr:hypothetical protein EW146_g9033 [Bondarzewia mesenterica]
MSSTSFDDPPWPERTPAPTHKLSKRKRRWNGAELLDHRFPVMSRQIVVNQTGGNRVVVLNASSTSWSLTGFANLVLICPEEARTQCQFLTGNNIDSCFPTTDSVFPQHEWATFVWNTNLPQFTQTNLVNIYLFHGDSNQLVLEMLNVSNLSGQGSVTAQVNDTWFPDSGLGWPGFNVSYPYYWVITRSDKTALDSTFAPTTFTAIQTTFADAVTSSRASASSAAAASSSSVAASLSSVAASLSSAAAASSRSAATATASRSGTASATSSSSTSSTDAGLQSDSGSNFPHWAIAVIVVLGFLAIVAICVLIFLIARRMRRNRSQASSRRGSMGSASPMITNTLGGGAPQSPIIEQSGMRAFGEPASIAPRPPSISSPDGASTISHTHSAGEALFSGADAAIMADAFRKALRKPDFAAPAIEEGESPESVERRDAELLNRELAEEGRDIRSVSSSRGVRVETLSDGGDAAHDHPR